MARGHREMKRLFATGALALCLVARVENATAAPLCHDWITVVGYRSCGGEFGRHWATETSWPWAFDVGAHVARIVPSKHGFSAPLDQNDQILGGLDFRFDVHFMHYLFAGGEIAHGGEVGGLDRYSSDTAGILIGARLPLGRVAIRQENLLGSQRFTLEHFVAQNSLQPQRTQYNSTWLVEPRVAVEVWLTPWLRVAGYGGTNLLDPTTWGGGLLVGYSRRAYSGAYR